MADHGRLPFGEMLAQFNPQDWHLGSPVNRPTYYVVNAIWCFLLGNNYTLWYVARVSCPFLAILTFWYAIGTRLGMLLGGLLTFCLATQPFWADVIPKSQSETFAAMGASLLILGVSLLLEPRRFSWRSCITPRLTQAASALILLGGLVAIGSKENFTVLVFLAVLPLLILSIIAKHPTSIVRAYSLVLAWGAIILYFIYAGELRRGVDLYGVGIRQRLDLISRTLSDANLSTVLLALYLLAAATLGVLRLTRGGSFSKTLNLVFVATGIQIYLCAARAFLYLFYNGAVVKADRYAFPYATIPVLSLALLIAVLMEIEFPGVRRPQTLRLNLGLAGGGILLVIAINAGVSSNRIAAEQYTASTLAFKDRLERVEAALRPTPSTPLLFRSFAPSDSESLASVVQYLRAAGIKNPFFLQINYDDLPSRPPVEHLMISITKGIVGPGRMFQAESDMPLTVPPVVITFSAPAPRPPALASFFPLP
jgi:hypothetical protein